MPKPIQFCGRVLNDLALCRQHEIPLKSELHPIVWQDDYTRLRLTYQHLYNHITLRKCELLWYAHILMLLELYDVCVAFIRLEFMQSCQRRRRLYRQEPPRHSYARIVYNTRQTMIKYYIQELGPDSYRMATLSFINTSVEKSANQLSRCAAASKVLLTQIFWIVKKSSYSSFTDGHTSLSVKSRN